MFVLQNMFRKTFFSSCIILPFFMYACGGDSGSSAAEYEYNEEEDDVLGGDAFKDSSITGTQYNSNAGVVSIIKSEVLDEKSGPWLRLTLRLHLPVCLQ